MDKKFVKCDYTINGKSVFIMLEDTINTFEAKEVGFAFLKDIGKVEDANKEATKAKQEENSKIEAIEQPQQEVTDV